MKVLEHLELDGNGSASLVAESQPADDDWDIYAVLALGTNKVTPKQVVILDKGLKAFAKKLHDAEKQSNAPAPASDSDNSEG